LAIPWTISRLDLAEALAADAEGIETFDFHGDGGLPQDSRISVMANLSALAAGTSVSDNGHNWNAIVYASIRRWLGA